VRLNLLSLSSLTYFGIFLKSISQCLFQEKSIRMQSYYVGNNNGQNLEIIVKYQEKKHGPTDTTEFFLYNEHSI